MKSVFSFLLAVTTSLFFAQGIAFTQGSFADLKTKARTENKKIFVDAYTTWCGPCRMMARDVFPDAEVGAVFNQHFISAKVDMEKGEGPTLGTRYNVSCYPTFLFLDSAGTLLHKFSGMTDPKTFVSLSHKALTPEQGFGALERRYNAGDRDPAFVTDYIRACGSACMPTGGIALSYLMGLHEKSLLEESNWNIFRENVDDVHSMPFTYLLNNRSRFIARFGEQQVDEKIFSSYSNYSHALLGNEKPDVDSLARFRAELAGLDFVRREELLLAYDLAEAARFSKWADYHRAGKSLVDKYRANDHDFLNTVSYTLFEHTDNKAMLADALRWAKMSVDIKAEPYNLDTYASLLWKNGRKADAVKVQKKAISAAKANGEDTSQLEETLKKIQGSKG